MLIRNTILKQSYVRFKSNLKFTSCCTKVELFCVNIVCYPILLLGRRLTPDTTREPLFAHDTWNMFAELQESNVIMTNNSMESWNAKVYIWISMEIS